MKTMILAAALLSSAATFAATTEERDISLEAAKHNLKKPLLEIHCEDGDGDDYYNVDVYFDDENRSDYAIIATHLGEFTVNEDGDLYFAEAAHRVKELSPRREGDHYFQVAKYASESLTVTVYQTQNLRGGLKCVIDSIEPSLVRELDGAMDGFTRR